MKTKRTQIIQITQNLKKRPKMMFFLCRVWTRCQSARLMFSALIHL